MVGPPCAELVLGNLAHPKASMLCKYSGDKTHLPGPQQGGRNSLCDVEGQHPSGIPGGPRNSQPLRAAGTRGLRGCTGNSPAPPSAPCCQPWRRGKSTWDLLFELGEGLGSGCAHDVVDLRDLVQLVGSREEWLQTGRRGCGQDGPSP